MDEQQQLNELKRKMVDTMSEMELKASELQQKLNKKMELSKSNAEMGIKRVALEYKVEELYFKLLYPPGYDPDPESDDDEDEPQKPQNRSEFLQQHHARANLQTPQAQQAQEAREEARQERFNERVRENRRVYQNMKVEALHKYREFETTKLKELGEDGWTLQSVTTLPLHQTWLMMGEGHQDDESWTNLYYFSRPL
jgi:hypothetical protein